jgi:uncharacterized protein (TIGR02996 family)
VSTPADLALARALVSEPRDLLLALLEAWRAYPSPQIAELALVANKRVEVPVRAHEGTLAQKQAQWLGVCELADPLDIPWLLEHAITSRKQETLLRLRALAKRAADPRTSTSLLERCVNPELRSHRPVWTVIFSILRKIGDRRIAPRIAELIATMRPVTEFDSDQIVRLTRLGEMIGAAEPLPPPHPQKALLDRLTHELCGDATAVAEAARAKTADDFFAEIWAAPDDVGVREVFADWLIERGDPRGELITLQLARARGTASEAGVKRERALLVEHTRAWLGALDPVISKSRCYFEGGFVTRCEVVWRRLGAQPELWKHPAWATVREYKLAPEGERTCDAWLDHMIALGAKRV